MIIHILIKTEVKFREKHKQVTIDRIPIELVEKETISELRERARRVYEEWVEYNHKQLTNTWYWLTGTF